MTQFFRGWFPRLNSRRYQRILIACLATLGVSASLLGTVIVVRWRADHAVRGDTRVVLKQAAEQLLRALQSRRGTLTLLRDAMDKAPTMAVEEQTALAISAVAHTRHLIGAGLIRANAAPTWWIAPTPTTSHERSAIKQVLTHRTTLRQVWRVPSTFTVRAGSTRPFLIMLEPLKAAKHQRSSIIGIFDLKPLLADFFELSLQQPFPVQLLEANQALYTSAAWKPPVDTHRHALIDHPLRLDAVHWVLQMQPGSTHAVKTLSWLNVLLIVFGMAAGLVTTTLIWLLAMRTWILQRAVSRRTAALRRTTERLRRLATTDELTGLYNRRFFLERWEWEHERAKRYERPLACLMIDVNGFKSVNDMLGHATGDLVLKHVAEELKTALRHSDILARFGGDEFIAALPETSLTQATSVAEKLRTLPISGPWAQGGRIGAVRLSVGVSEIDAGDESAQQVLQRADASMYASRTQSSFDSARDDPAHPGSRNRRAGAPVEGSKQ